MSCITIFAATHVNPCISVFLHMLYFQWQDHLEYSTKGPTSNMHRGSTRVLQTNKVMHKEALLINVPHVRYIDCSCGSIQSCSQIYFSFTKNQPEGHQQWERTSHYVLGQLPRLYSIIWQSTDWQNMVCHYIRNPSMAHCKSKGWDRWDFCSIQRC